MSKVVTFFNRPAIRDRLIIVALGLFFFIPFLGSVHLFDWDEINFAEAAREMIVTGDFMRVNIDFQPFWEKPPLFFWLQALSMKAFGVTEFAARFVNAMFGIATLLIVYGIGKRLYDRKFGFLWSLAFLGSFLPHIFFKSGIIDPVFNLFIFLGIYNLARATGDPDDRTLRRFFFGGAFIGLAVLTKGPVAYLLVLLATGVFQVLSRSWKTFSIKEIGVFTAGTALIALLFYGTETIWHGTWFMEEFIRYHLRLFSTQDAGHGRPFYFHFLITLFGVFPASIFAVRAFFFSADSNQKQHVFKRWMLILFWVVLILFSIVRTKTVLYSSLVYFPVTFLAAYHLHAIVTGKLKWRRFESIFIGSFSTLIGIVLMAFPVLMVYRERWLHLIDDPYTVGMLSKPVDWSLGLAAIGFLYGSGVLLSLLHAARNRVWSGATALFIVSAIGIQVTMIGFVGRVENHSQRGPIEFYKSLAGRDVYARSLFKTYADEFYLRKTPLDKKEAYDKHWLLSGPIKKPAYFVTRTHQLKSLLENFPDLHVLKNEYGYVYLRRDPVTDSKAGSSDTTTIEKLIRKN